MTLQQTVQQTTGSPVTETEAKEFALNNFSTLSQAIRENTITPFSEEEYKRVSEIMCNSLDYAESLIGELIYELPKNQLLRLHTAFAHEFEKYRK